MPSSDNFALVPRPPGGVEEARPGAKRILSGMVEGALELAQKKPVSPVPQRFRIGDYEWCEPDYRQLLIWAQKLGVKAEVVVDELLSGEKPAGVPWAETVFENGRIIKLNWDTELLPLRELELGHGLRITHLSLSSRRCFSRLLSRSGVYERPESAFACCQDWVEYKKTEGEKVDKILDDSDCPLEILNLPDLPELTHLSCSESMISDCAGGLSFRGTPKLELLECDSGLMEAVDVRPLVHLKEVKFSLEIIQRPDQHFLRT